MQISLKTKYELKGQWRSHEVKFNSPFCKSFVCFLFDYVQFGSNAILPQWSKFYRLNILTYKLQHI